MSKRQSDQKGNQGTEQSTQPKGSQPKKDEENRHGAMQGEQKGGQMGQQEPERDQLDDQGRRRQMGHDDEQDGQGRGRPFEEDDPNEKLGRPVKVGEGSRRSVENDRKAQAGQWDDKTEGTSRRSGPAG